MLPQYYEQYVEKNDGAGVDNTYTVDIKFRKGPIHIQAFKSMISKDADIPNARGKAPSDQEEVWQKREKKFWSSIHRRSKNDQPIRYAGDLMISLFNTDPAYSWNLNRLDSVLNTVGQRYGGVTDSMLYVGQYRAMFACHVEDADLYSINYLHYGLPKSWYCIPPSERFKFENYAAAIFPEDNAECVNFLRHKTKMFSPKFLQDHGIRFHTVVQLPGEYVIPMPGAYHFGFNHGFNVAEATNYATPRWFDIGRRCTHCTCDRGNVSIEPWKISRMETLWLRQRHASFITPFTDIVKRMRCSCTKNDTYDPITKQWSGQSSTKDTWIFECASCKLYCHWNCIFGPASDAEGSGDDENNATHDDAEYLCHECHELEFPTSVNMVVMPVKLNSHGRVVSSAEPDDDSSLAPEPAAHRAKHSHKSKHSDKPPKHKKDKNEKLPKENGKKHQSKKQKQSKSEHHVDKVNSSTSSFEVGSVFALSTKPANQRYELVQINTEGGWAAVRRTFTYHHGESKKSDTTTNSPLPLKYVNLMDLQPVSEAADAAVENNNNARSPGTKRKNASSAVDETNGSPKSKPVKKRAKTLDLLIRADMFDNEEEL